MSTKMTAFASVALTTLIWAGAAHAQGADRTAEAAEAPSADPDLVEEVVVTAQRRSERLVDVPISVTAASPQDIERAGGASIENLTKVTPGTFFQRTTYGLSPTVRGIGSTLGGEQNVALYVDNIYYPALTGNIFDLASVAGIEVLKGPQGTLFGRNATGGAVLIRTREPGFVTEGRVSASYERFDQVRASGYLNIPLGDKVAVNGAVAYRYSDGYVRDIRSNAITNQGDNFTIRAKLLLQPTDSFSAVFTVARAELDDPTGTISQNLAPAPLLFTGNYGPIATDRFHTSKAQPEETHISSEEYSARATLETPWGTLASYTAFLENHLSTKNDLSSTYYPLQITSKSYSKTFSQEVNLTSPSNQPLTYVAGVYYFNNRPTAPGSTTNGTPTSSSKSKIESVSGYLDGTYTVGDLSFIGGIRYSYEKRENKSAPGQIQPAPYTRFQEATEKQWTPRVGLKYALSDRTNIYATYSRGFKAGVFDSATLTGPGVRPETVNAFEAGLKTASNAFTFSGAAFYYDYEDTQVSALVSGQNGVVFNQLVNVPKARIYGLEGDALVRLGDHFDVRLAAAWVHSRYVDFPNAPGWILRPGAMTFANVPVEGSGNQMVRAPEFTASSTIRYYTPIADNKELEIAVSPFYSSRVYHTFDNVLSQAPYATVDATATLTLNNNMKFSVFGRNIFDAKYAMRKAQNSLTLNATIFAAPATYGVSFGYSF